MQLFDRYNVQLIGDYLEQEVIINFYFECIAATMTDPIVPSIYAAGFYSNIGEGLLDQLSNEVDLHTLRLTNYIDENEFFEVGFLNSGTRTGDAMPAFVAHGIQLTRGSRATRNGSRRIPGVMEGDTAGGSLPPAPIRNGILAAFIAGDTYDDGANEFNAKPIIVGRDSLGRIEPTRVSDVVGAVYKRITTQNSRKPGRGR